ncbi:MAG: hypothetical protein EPO40_01760 [Myxococcaceae bacterium]|nr:MAG: hypothetical protein EPO40_01760 [Myxococcaceae bacterium]
MKDLARHVAELTRLPPARRCGPEEALEIMRQVARIHGLDAAVRELASLSPRMILVHPHGFGLDLQRERSTEEVVGFYTPEYLMKRPLTVRSVLWTLAAVGYWALSGESPWRHASLANLRQAADDGSLEPSPFVAAPTRFQDRLLRLLSVDGHPGVATSERMFEVLEGDLTGDARVAPRPLPPPAPPKREPGLSARALGAILVGTLVLAAAALTAIHRRRDAAPIAPEVHRLPVGTSLQE